MINIKANCFKGR